MKRKILFVWICLLALISNAESQPGEVKVTPEKVIYKRTSNKVPEFKKTFVVTYPRFSGIENPVVLKTLLSSVNYWKAFGISLEENLSRSFWLESLKYKVAYNKHNILGIELFIEGSGAYPDESVKKLVLDLRTGRRIFLNDAFTDIPGLLLSIDKEQQSEINIAKSESKKRGANIATLINRPGSGVSRIEEFSVSDAGVIFYYDYGFPNAMKALEPKGRYFFSWADLRGHIKPNGVLARFAN